MSQSERGEHNEIGFRNVDEDAQHDEAGSQGPGPGGAPEGEQREPKPGGAEGGESDAADTAPAAPADDSSALGDTDQHSSADA
jgi:hypothetical protein